MPCENCLILGICKNRINKYYEEEIEYEKYIYERSIGDVHFEEDERIVKKRCQEISIEGITYDCELIYDYIYSIKVFVDVKKRNIHYKQNEERVWLSVKFFFGRNK